MRTARRSIMIPPPLWDALGVRAEEETKRRGRPVNRSDIAREAVELHLGIDYRNPYAELAPERLDAEDKQPAGVYRGRLAPGQLVRGDD